MEPKPNFGEWFRRIRQKLGISQQRMAAVLGLKTYITIRNWEQAAGRGMQGSSAEEVLELLGYRSEEDLDRAWKAGELPDIDRIRDRLRKAEEVARGEEGGTLFDAALTSKLFHWLAAHPGPQLRTILRAVSKNDAAAVARALVERVAEGDDGGGRGNVKM